jgi:hypothetical protein
VNRIIIFMLLGFLSACTGLDLDSTKIDIGSTKDEVLKTLGNPLEQSTEGGVLAWQYGARVAFGYCEYKEFYFLGDKVIDTHQYYHSSMAGCRIGLQKIDWAPVLTKAQALGGANPKASTQTTQP